MKRIISPVEITNEKQPKKIKEQDEIDNKNTDMDMDKYKDVDKLQQDNNIKEVHHWMVKIGTSMNDKSLVKAYRQKLKEFNVNDIVCALLFYSKNAALFTGIFSACCIELMQSLDKFDHFEEYLMDEYDQDNASEDFSIGFFFNRSNYCTLIRQICDILNDKAKIKESFCAMIDLWMKENPKSLTILYSDYFDNFSNMFKMFNMHNSELAVNLHDKCIETIFDTIKDIDERVVNQMYDVYEKIQSGEDFDSDTEETMITRFEKTLKQIGEQVDQWEGDYPFSGLMNGFISVRDTFKMIDEL